MANELPKELIEAGQREVDQATASMMTKATPDPDTEMILLYMGVPPEVVTRLKAVQASIAESSLRVPLLGVMTACLIHGIQSYEDL